jgi:hypothetical protein
MEMADHAGSDDSEFHIGDMGLVDVKDVNAGIVEILRRAGKVAFAV